MVQRSGVARCTAEDARQADLQVRQTLAGQGRVEARCHDGVRFTDGTTTHHEPRREQDQNEPELTGARA